MITVNQEKLDAVLNSFDCANCPLRNYYFRCAANVGVVAPLNCYDILIKWLKDEPLLPYWKDEEYQKEIERIEEIKNEI